MSDERALDAEELEQLDARGPAELSDPLVRREMKKAAVWIGMALAVAAVIVLAEPLLLIFGGVVFAAILDGGTRLLGRVLPIGRGWRLLIISLLALAFIVGTIWFAGVQLTAQFARAARHRHAADQPAARAGRDLRPRRRDRPAAAIVRAGDELAGPPDLRRVVAFSAASPASSMIVIIGLFIAIEPRIYERGIAWMLPSDMRARYFRTSDRIGKTLRHLMAGRLLGMAVEGVGTWLLLLIGGVPMAALLGLLTGILAFLPNIGAIISGALIILIGFSVNFETGLWAVAVYLIVQIVDGYLIVPYVAKKTVDLAPALVLGAQVIFGALFGIMGLALADPLVAMMKAALDQKSVDDEAAAEAEAPPPAGPRRPDRLT